ncbi:hypothetical protein Tco_0310936, partial [Tanacetum coccineum]
LECLESASVVPTISISTVTVISIVHIVSHLSDNLRKNGLQLICDNSSDVRVLVVVVIVVAAST